MAQAHENISHFHNTMYRRQNDCRYAGYPSLESKFNLFSYVHIVEDHVKEVNINTFSSFWALIVKNDLKEKFGGPEKGRLVSSCGTRLPPSSLEGKWERHLVVFQRMPITAPLTGVIVDVVHDQPK